MITITQKQLQQISNHAQRTYPEECCGLLLGKNKIVQEVWETENSWDGDDPNASKKNRFTIAPEVMLKAQKYAREQDLEIIGIYHSHPDHSAIPSEIDRAIAWSEYSYLIVSVQKAISQEILSWTLDDNHQFQSETINYSD